MTPELDYELTPDQWEALKALRLPAAERSELNRCAVDQLIALDLAARRGDLPVITPRGRKVLIRGSSRLLDVAA